MQSITPTRRADTPFARPQAIASDGHRLWIGSIATSKVYALDPADFSVLEEHDAPGKPWGLACVGQELRVICGVTDEDHRNIYRFTPGSGFQGEPLPCPDDTGSHLGHDGEHLYVSQWYNQQLVALDTLGRPGRTLKAPHGIAGQVIVGRKAYLLTTSTDDDKVLPFYITRLDLDSGEAEDVAELHFHARGLAFDGLQFWSNLREEGATISFKLP